MKYKYLIIILIIICISAIGCSVNEREIYSPEIDRNNKESSRVDVLWDKTIHKMLQEPLWKERDAYDAGHYLMVPLHAVFYLEDKEKIDDFHNFFNCFIDNYKKDDFNSLNNLTQLQFLYLASEYLVLSVNSEDLFIDELLLMIIESIDSIWYQPAWHWKACDSPDFQKMSDRINWKLENKETSYGYCRSIIDVELYTFAIAGNLKFILKNKSPEFVDEILDISYKVFKEEVVFLDAASEQWLFQPGVRFDHPDYAYAGWDYIAPDLEKKLVPGIAMDISHFHRFPLWLKSLQRGFLAKEELDKSSFFETLEEGLANQFINKVLVEPSAEFPNYRTTNFMDGHNGIYRYGYVTQGEGKGYGPYELSGTMLLGWWSFLPDNSIKDVYYFISQRHPFTEREIDLYLGPGTSRDRHSLIKGKAKYENGLTEIINILACENF